MDAEGRPIELLDLVNRGPGTSGPTVRPTVLRPTTVASEGASEGNMTVGERVQMLEDSILTLGVVRPKESAARLKRRSCNL